MVDFKSLKLKRESSLKQINQQIETLNKKSFEADNRFWTPTVDKAGNGFAIIRFLPAAGVDGDAGVPFVRQFTHRFEGPGGWLIDRCLTSLSQPCPVCESNTELWDTKIEANQNLARKRKRKLDYISNIYVVSDPAHPEFEGKVFLYRYGKKIFDKLEEKMSPKFPTEKPLNPFDLWEGASLKLKIKTEKEYRNYDSSEFDAVGPLSTSDEALEKIWSQAHSLAEYVDPKHFKSYEDIAKRLTKVLGVKAAATPKAAKLPVPETKSTGASLLEAALAAAPSTPALPEVEEDDDEMQDFQDLADHLQ